MPWTPAHHICSACLTTIALAGIVPGDDFFTYANGEWLDATSIPEGKPKWSAASEITAAAGRQLATVIHEAGASGSPVYSHKVADFYAAYGDEVGIEKAGLAPIAPQLKEISDLRDKAALSRWLGANLRADVDPLNLGIFDSQNLFGFASSYGIHGEPTNFAYLTQGGLALGDRDAYLDDTPAAKVLRAQYRDYIARLLEAMGQDKPAQRADAVLALETAIARGHATAAESSEDSNADHAWSRGDFQVAAPGIDWTAFFSAAGLSRQQDIVVWQPAGIKTSAALVASQPLQAWQDYLRFHLAHRYADVLPRVVAQAARDFRSAQGGKLATATREEIAIDATNRAMPMTVGRLYTDYYFPPSSKKRAQSIVDHVVAAFRKRVAASEWMTPASKRIALAKLNVMRFQVGYPDAWIDDAKPFVDAHDAVGNLRRLDEWKYRETLAKVGREVDRREWFIAPQTPGAVLNFQLNAYNFAAGLLQSPKFDPDASDAAAYGSIGAIFAHEVSHFVDTLGADFDTTGATHGWWTAEDKARYEAATRPLVAQFSAYHPIAGATVDGQRTLVENMADLGGLSAAFDAYREVVGQHAVTHDELHQMDREFFIAYARAWRSTIRDEALRAMLKSDSHAPDRYRIATVRNLDAWYEAFDVKPGQALYLDPKERVKVW
jgi:putative endopeptidase